LSRLQLAAQDRSADPRDHEAGGEPLDGADGIGVCVASGQTSGPDPRDVVSLRRAEVNWIAPIGLTTRPFPVPAARPPDPPAGPCTLRRALARSQNRAPRSDSVAA